MDEGARQPVGTRFFGLHIHNVERLPRWPDVPFAAWRLWDAEVAWRDLEPEKGRWQFDKLDALLKIAEDQKVRVLLTLGSTPQWASARPEEKCAYGKGCAAEPENLVDWDAYVRAVVTRYKGRIEAYELWNEVHFSDHGDAYDASGAAYFYSGTAAAMVALARRARAIVQEVDPNAKLLSPSFHVYGDWIKKLSLFLAIGGARYTDVVSFHFYARDPEDTLRTVAAVRRVLAAQGRPEMPIWNTEVGYVLADGTRPFASGMALRSDLAAYVLRTFVLSAGAGLDRVYWYAWDNGIMGLADRDGNPVEASDVAYQAAARWLTNRIVEKCSGDAAVWICALRHGAKQEWVLWRRGSVGLWTIPSTWKATQVENSRGEIRQLKNLTIELGPVPILVKGQ